MQIVMISDTSELATLNTSVIAALVSGDTPVFYRWNGSEWVQGDRHE